MTATHPSKSLVTSLVVLGLAAVSLAAWLGEILLLNGWAGLVWLEGSPKAVFVGAACAVVAVALPIRAASGKPTRVVARFFVLAYPIALVSFLLAQSSVYALHSRANMLSRGDLAGFIVVNLTVLFAAAALTAVGFTVSARRVLAPVRWRMAALLLVALALVMPMSMLTIWAIPAVNDSTDYIHAVKMGYPAFWTPVLMALASHLGSRPGTT